MAELLLHDCWGIPNSLELLALSLRHQMLTSSTLKASCISLMIEPVCLCPETNAAHPTCQAVQFSGRSGIHFWTVKPHIPFPYDCPRSDLGASFAKVCWCISTPSFHPHSHSSSFEGTSEGLLVQVLLRIGPTITLVFSFSRKPGLNTNFLLFSTSILSLPIHCLYKTPERILVDRNGLVFAMVITMQVTQATGTATHFCL